MGTKAWSTTSGSSDDSDDEGDADEEDPYDRDFCRCEDCGFASVVPRRCPSCGGSIQ